MTSIFNGSITVGTWGAVTNNTNIGGLFIAEKQPFQSSDSIDIAKVDKITLELGLDIGSGGAHKYVSLQKVNAKFGQGFIDNATDDVKTAVVDVRSLPKKNFNVRVIAVTLDDGSIVDDGSMSCSLGVELIW